ncbi:hypothetical protein TNCV_2859671 [Trichonephila clavipes]|nr:hypothetical protein TNCV_2859671 [Trichonephila clavipes]
MTLAFSQSPPSSPNLAPPPGRGKGEIPEGETSGIPATVTQEFYFILPREQFVCDIRRAPYKLISGKHSDHQWHPRSPPLERSCSRGHKCSRDER